MHNILVTYLLWVAEHNVFHSLEITQLWVTTEKPCSKLDFPYEPGLSQLEKSKETTKPALQPIVCVYREERADEGHAKVRISWGSLAWQRQLRCTGRGWKHIRALKAITVVPASAQAAVHLQAETLVIDFKAVRLPLTFKKLLLCLPLCLCSALQCDTLSSWHWQEREGVGYKPVFPGCCTAYSFSLRITTQDLC